MARPTFKPTLKEKKLVEKLSGLGVVQLEIITMVRDGISIQTLEKYFRRELDIGMARAHSRIAGAIFNRALKGSDNLLMFYAKTQMKWREPKDESEQQNVTINIIGGLPDE
jgi:hypothetical protein